MFCDAASSACGTQRNGEGIRRCPGFANKANRVLNEAVLDQGIFKQQGGIKRANKLFDEPVADILERFNRALWGEVLLQSDPLTFVA